MKSMEEPQGALGEQVGEESLEQYATHQTPDQLRDDLRAMEEGSERVKQILSTLEKKIQDYQARIVDVQGEMARQQDIMMKQEADSNTIKMELARREKK